MKKSGTGTQIRHEPYPSPRDPYRVLSLIGSALRRGSGPGFPNRARYRMARDGLSAEGPSRPKNMIERSISVQRSASLRPIAIADSNQPARKSVINGDRSSPECLLRHLTQWLGRLSEEFIIPVPPALGADRCPAPIALLQRRPCLPQPLPAAPARPPQQKRRPEGRPHTTQENLPPRQRGQPPLLPAPPLDWTLAT